MHSVIFFHFFNDAEELKNALSAKYKIKDLEETKEFLGIRIREIARLIIKINQEEFIERMLDRFNMNECRPVGIPMELKKKLVRPQSDEKNESRAVPYQNLIRSLMYLATWTRSDIAHAASVLNQFNTCGGALASCKENITISERHNQDMSYIQSVRYNH